MRLMEEEEKCVNEEEEMCSLHLLRSVGLGGEIYLLSPAVVSREREV